VLSQCIQLLCSRQQFEVLRCASLEVIVSLIFAQSVSDDQRTTESTYQRSLFSKLVHKSYLVDYLTSNKLLNPHQSAYCKHHSTETALSYIHDYLINAIGSHKVSCLCLLNLSAAFHTIDHDILISCLSPWFSFRCSVLNWFKSYLSSRSFHVKCDNHLSSLYSASCGVPQGSVLGPLLSSYTPLPSALSSLPFLSTTTFMQMTLSCSSPFIHLTLTQTLLTFKMLYSRSLLG